MRKPTFWNALMPRGKIDIVIEPGLLRVQYDAIRTSPHRRFYIGLGHLLFFLTIICLFIFASGKHGAPSVWQDLNTYPAGSSGFLFPVGFVLAFFLICVWHLTRIVPAIYPGGQKLECDGLTLTVSRMRWFDWENKEWISESYLLKDVSRFRYGVLVSGRGNSIFGFKFRAAGRSYRLFPYLTTREVGKILSGLEGLGVETDRRRKASERRLKEQ